MHLPFALSPSHFISNVGADAGFAALIGLAILVLLYFAHAREAKTHREELESARLRIDALERRAASATVSTPVPVAPRPTVAAPAAAAGLAAPAGATALSTLAPATQAAKPPGPATAPLAAPAGMAAPASIDATRVVPAFEAVAEAAETDGRSSAVPAQALSAEAGTGAGAPPARPASTSGAAATAAPPPPAPPRPAAPVVGRMPSPVTAAAGGNGFAPRVGAPPLRQGSLLREGLPGQRRRRSLRLLVPLLVAVAVVAVVVGLVVVLTGSGSGGSGHVVAHRSASSQMTIALKKVVPSSVTVAVLNGTTVNELAHRTSQRLSVQGYKQGQLATASNQSARTTSVGYLPGHRLAALAVAHALKLTAAAVAPAQSASKALACPGSAPCAADVIVTVGSDLAHAP